MTLDKYEIFLKVAESGNISRTAEQLNYTQSAISHIIKNLEAELGVTLIIRERNGVRLSMNGRRLLENIRRIVKEENALKKEAALMNRAELGVIRVGTTFSTSMEWMPDIICRLRDGHPGIEVAQLQAEYRTIEEGLESGDLDFGFLTDKLRGDFHFVPLARDEYFVLLPEDHHLASLEAIPVELLNGQPFIQIYEGGDFYDASSLVADVDPDIRYVVHDDIAAIPMVARGLGITVISSMTMNWAPSEHVVRKRFAFPRYRVVGLAMRKEEKDSPLASLFLDTVRSYLADREAEGGHFDHPVSSGSY
jgi:DNA-binding transcriptional LysR family regulator